MIDANSNSHQKTQEDGGTGAVWARWMVDAFESFDVRVAGMGTYDIYGTDFSFTKH